MHRKKKKKSIKYTEVELNIMPFIDVFSMLNTFLLFSAVFIAIGILEVQIPFLTNAPPPKEQKSNRFLNINVEVEKEIVKVVKVYSAEPAEKEEWEYKMNTEGIGKMHRKLIDLRIKYDEVDKASVYSEDDVTFAQLTEVLDAIKLRWDGDPTIPTKDVNNLKQKASDQSYVYPKVVMASVIL